MNLELMLTLKGRFIGEQRPRKLLRLRTHNLNYVRQEPYVHSQELLVVLVTYSNFSAGSDYASSFPHPSTGGLLTGGLNY